MRVAGPLDGGKFGQLALTSEYRDTLKGKGDYSNLQKKQLVFGFSNF